MADICKKLFLTVYAFAYIGAGIAMFFRDETRPRLALNQASGCVVFTLGLYTACGLLFTRYETQNRYFCVQSVGRVFAVAFMLLQRVLWHPIVFAELAYLIVVVTTTPVFAIAAARQENKWLKLAQGAHAVFGGGFGVVVACLPWLAMKYVDGGREDWYDAVFLGSLESTMTVAYGMSAMFDGDEHRRFVYCSCLSRTIAAIALFVWGHELARGGVYFGILSVVATLYALRRDSRPL
jgi:hypothetical protein